MTRFTKSLADRLSDEGILECVSDLLIRQYMQPIITRTKDLRNYFVAKQQSCFLFFSLWKGVWGKPFSFLLPDQLLGFKQPGSSNGS